jgi:uncharacterized oxidoreductase
VRLTGKIVLLTGAGSGIGRATAILLARHQARLVLFGRRAEPLHETASLVRDAGGIAEIVAGDIGDPAARSASLAAAERLGGLDILINNAGGVMSGRLETIAEADLRALIEVNLIAPILLTQAALPLLGRSSDAAIVNVSSGMGLIGMPLYTVYTAAKAGIARFGEALRREVAPRGIRVLTLYPTATETPMMASSRIGSDQGIIRETPEAVADALVAGLLDDASEVVRGGAERMAMIQRNLVDPNSVDAHFATILDGLEAATRGHRSL